MGIEIQVTSLEEMCDLMCDNRPPNHKEKYNEQGEMFVSDAIKIVKAKADCLDKESHNHQDCCNDNCEKCDFGYAQGTVEEQIEALRIVANIVEGII